MDVTWLNVDFSNFEHTINEAIKIVDSYQN